MAVRSPLLPAELVPLYAQLGEELDDHPRLFVLRASTPLVSPLGSPL